MPRDSPGTPVFWYQQSLVGDSPESCTQSDPPPFEHNDFDQHLLIAPQPWELEKKVQLLLIGSWLCAFMLSSEPYMNRVRYPFKSKGWHKTCFRCFLPVKFNFSRKESAANFLCVKTFRGEVEATPVLYLMVHRWIAVDVRIYVKFALVVTNP